MIYNPINYIQRISKEIHMPPKWHCFASLHIISDQEYKVWSKFIYLLKCYTIILSKYLVIQLGKRHNLY
jgi:hypothetical protein